MYPGGKRMRKPPREGAASGSHLTTVCCSSTDCRSGHGLAPTKKRPRRGKPQCAIARSHEVGRRAGDLDTEVVEQSHHALPELEGQVYRSYADGIRFQVPVDASATVFAKHGCRRA